MDAKTVPQTAIHAIARNAKTDVLALVVQINHALRVAVDAKTAQLTAIPAIAQSAKTDAVVAAVTINHAQ